MRLFKKKQKEIKNTWPGEINRTWWEGLKALYKKDNPRGVIDESDPEYSAQKIYKHWLKSFL